MIVQIISCHCKTFPNYMSTELKKSVLRVHTSNHLVSLSLITKWPAISINLPLIILQTQRALSPRRLVQWASRVSSPLSPTNSHFKAIFQVQFYQIQQQDSSLLVTLKSHSHILAYSLKNHYLIVIIPSDNNQFIDVVVLIVFQIRPVYIYLTCHWTNMAATLQISAIQL